MRSELERPDLADTPELFSRIEANLVQEANRIRSRRLARQRRTRWYEGLRPLATTGAAFAAMLMLIPLTQQPALTTTEGPIGETVAAAAQSDDVAPAAAVTIPDSYLDRLPEDDQAEMVVPPFIDRVS